MPIDFVAAATHLAAIAFQDRLANTSGRLIEAALLNRTVNARAADARTGDLPTLWFQDGALAVRVLVANRQDAAQGVSGFPGTAQFEAGFQRWWRAATDLPDLITAVDQVLGAVDASIARYAAPTPDVFDPQRRTIFDLFGVAGALLTGIRDANLPGGAFDRICDALRTSAAMLRSPPPSQATASGAGGTGPSAAADPTESVILAATLAFAALPTMVCIVLSGLAVRIRILALEQLQMVEGVVRGWIASTYLGVFSILRGTARGLVLLMRALQQVVGRFADASVKLVLGLGGALGSAVGGFVYQVAHFLRAVVILMALLVEILAFLGLDWDVPKPPAVNLATGFPNIGTSLFGADVRRRVGEIIQQTDVGVRSTLTSGFGQLADGLDKVATGFTQAAPGAELGTFAPPVPVDADRMAALLLPTEATRRSHDQIAQPFEAWLADRQTWHSPAESAAAGGAAGTLIAVLDGYAREVAQLWRARRADEPTDTGLQEGTPTPTSPHILRRHAAVGQVQVPRVLIRVGGATDDDTLDRVAAAFSETVRDAYRQGAARFEPRHRGR